MSEFLEAAFGTLGTDKTENWCENLSDETGPLRSHMLKRLVRSNVPAKAGYPQQQRKRQRPKLRWNSRGQRSQYTQARIGGNHLPESTGKFIVAKFEHDTARPVDGYVAPQLHTHAVVFNITERNKGETRALQPHSLFASQQFATAIYQSELTYRLRQLGYREVVRDFAVGDRVQFTAPDKFLSVANRDLAIIEPISSESRLVAQVDGGRRSSSTRPKTVTSITATQ